MKISRNSWAYRWWSFMHPYSYPRDLCSYIRSLVFTTMLGVAVSVTLGIILLSPFAEFYFGGDTNDVWPVGVFLWAMIGAAYGGYLLIRETADWRHERRTYNYFNKEPSLVSQWYRAKKQKICPLIEVTE